MECKVYSLCKANGWRIDWNIYRMECKDVARFDSGAYYNIGIYPEWNVKDVNEISIFNLLSIGIYPEWNVK